MDAFPHELIADIFNLVVHGRESAPTPLQLFQLPSTLSHVNHRLRHIALSTATLWTSIGVSHSRHALHSRQSRLKACLVRSKGCRLDILVDVRQLGEDEARDCIAHLRLHAARWSSFTLLANWVESPAAARVTIAALANIFQKCSTPKLQVLDLATEGSNAEVEMHNLVVRAGGLRRLQVKQMGLEWSGISLPLLEELTLEGLRRPGPSYLVGLVGLLVSSPLLKSVELRDTRLETDTIDMPSDSINLPNLDNLVLDNASLPLIHLLLSSLKAPNLRRIRVSPSDCPQELDWSIPSSSLDAVEHFEWDHPSPSPSVREELRAVTALRAVIARVRRATHVRVSGQPALQLLLAGAGDVAPASILPNLACLECQDLAKTDLAELSSWITARAQVGLPRVQKLGISAGDVSLPSSAGRLRMEAQDEMMEALHGGVEELVVRDKQDRESFRFTFLGWKDYQRYLRAGRRTEYECEMEE